MSTPSDKPSVEHPAYIAEPCAHSHIERTGTVFETTGAKCIECGQEFVPSKVLRDLVRWIDSFRYPDGELGTSANRWHPIFTATTPELAAARRALDEKDGAS